MTMEFPDFPVLLDNKTYDIKKFLRDHPGGANTLKNYKGKSVLQAMVKFGHSTSAFCMLKDFVMEGVEDSNLTGGVSVNGRIITKQESGRDLEKIAFLEELESRLDWSKPIVGQLDEIAPHYSAWVNSAVYRKCRLFYNPLLEWCSNTPWYLVPMYWIPIILYLGYTQFEEHVSCGDSCTSERMSIWRFVGELTVGFLAWTALEYTLHRWVFHLDPGNNLTMIKIHFLIHGLHHKTPFDGLRQVFPPLPATLIAWFLYWLISFVFPYPTIQFVGGVTGYLIYDMIHFYVHHGSPRDGTYLYEMKRYHSNHHFVNHDKAFGISSKIWDYVFRTIVHLRKLGFSLKW